ncbi:MAG TPA: hypothetical protein VGE52_03820 [Pirellulales bacterium]
MRRFFTRTAAVWLAGVSLTTAAATALAQDDPAPAPVDAPVVVAPATPGDPAVTVDPAAPVVPGAPGVPVKVGEVEVIAPGGLPYAEEYVPGMPGEPRRIGNGTKPGIPPQMIYYQGQQDLFYNYYVGPGTNGQYTAGMYKSPMSWIPNHVGSTAYTYQPFYPHHYLAEHELWYTNGDRHVNVKYMHRGGQIHMPNKFVGDRWWPRGSFPTANPYRGSGGAY